MRLAVYICLHPITHAPACRRTHTRPAVNVSATSLTCAPLSGASQTRGHAQDARHPAHNPHLCQRQGCALDRFKSQPASHTASAAATPIPQNAHLPCLPTHFLSRRLCSATWRASSSCTPLPLKYQQVVSIVLIHSTGTRGSWAVTRHAMAPGEDGSHCFASPALGPIVLYFKTCWVLFNALVQHGGVLVWLL